MKHANAVIALASCACAMPAAAFATDGPVKVAYLQRNNIDPKKVIPEATLVPSGVAEVSRLQFKEGYAYLRP